MQNALGISVDILGKDSLSGPAGVAGAALSGLEKTAGVVGSALGGLEKIAAGVAGAVTAMAASVTAAVAVGVVEAGKLQQAVANISTIKTGINTDGLFSSLNLMQTKVAQSAQQMGAALYDIFSSIDVSARQGLQLVEKFSKGAIASITDAKTFGTAIVGEMNAFKLGVQETDHLMDVFFETIKLGVVTGQELASSLGQVTQAAKQAGIGVDEMSALIAGVTKEGGPAADNMEHLTRLLEELHTKAANSGFKFLGIEATEMGGKLKDPIQLLTELRDRMANFTESARQTALMEIFPNIRARQAAMVLMNELDTVNAALEENQSKTGAAGEAYEKMAATFDTQTKLLRQTFDSILTSVGSGLLPVLTSVTASVQDFAAKTAPLWDDWQNRLKAAFKTGGFSAWLTEVGAVAGELGKQIEKWVPAFSGWVENGKTTLGNALTKVYTETVVPWVTQKAEELKKQFETVWVPNLVSWWNSTETQGKLKGAMDDFGGKVKTWAGEGGDGNKLFKEAGESLSSALLAGMTSKLSALDEWTNNFTNEVRKSIRQAAQDGKFGWLSQTILETTKGVANAPGSSGSGGPTVVAPPGSPGSTAPGSSPSTSAPTSNPYNINSTNLVPSQFNLDEQLTPSEAAAACGPAAAVGFARIFGHTPTLRQALELARDKELWDPVLGMHGAGAEVALLGAMGVSAHVENVPKGGDLDWAKIQAEIKAGRPTIIDTPNHYFEASQYNAQTGQYFFGASGQVYGHPWMTPDELRNVGAGAPRAAIYADASNTNAVKATDYKTLARAYAAQYGVDPDIYEAMINEESKFDPSAYNQKSGARGIAQFMIPTGNAVAGQLGINEKDFWGDPNSQLQGGAFYLSQLLAQFKGDPEKALAAYNWGPGNVAGGGTPPGETQAYVARILAAAKAKQSSGAPASPPPSVDDNPDDPDIDHTKKEQTPGTEDPYKLTPEKLAAALGGAEADAAAGAKGRALLEAYTDAIAGEKPHALEKLTALMADLKQSLLNDPALSPEEAKARYQSVMEAVSAGLLGGGEEAQATARSLITDFEQSLSIDKIQTAADKKAKELQTAADKAIATAEASRDKAIASLTTTKEAAVADRDAEQAESERIAKAVEGSKVYVKAQEDQLQAVHALAKEERDFQQDRAALDLKYLEDLALIQTKKRATDMSGVMAPTAHTDPQAALNQDLRDKAAAHNVDVFNLTQQQQIKRDNHDEDVKWKLEETALASTLKATILDPTAETAKTTMNDWKDAYDYTVKIPREAATKWGDTELAISKIKSDQADALSKLATDSDTAKARITSLTEPTGLPSVQTAADTALKGYRADAEAARDAVIAAGIAAAGGTPPSTGGNPTSSYSTGSASPRSGPTETGGHSSGGGGGGTSDPGEDPNQGGVWNHTEGSSSADHYMPSKTGMAPEIAGGLGAFGNYPEQLGGGLTSGNELGKGSPRLSFLESVTPQMREKLANAVLGEEPLPFSSPFYHPTPIQTLQIGNPQGWQWLQTNTPVPPPQLQFYAPPPNVGMPGNQGNYALVPTGGGQTGIAGNLSGWKLPGFATGVENFRGGWAMVGEMGPESVYLPQGSSVYPNGSGPSGGDPIDYDRLAAAMSNLSVQVNQQTLGQVVRTGNNYYAQSNLPNGVGALVGTR